MCGIAGIYHFKTARPVEDNAVICMNDTMVHRGPDDQGVYTEGAVGLGHRRLSIIDLKNGHQPMIADDGAVLVFNGEIYNYIEIREKLKPFYTFKTHSDSEVILAAYQKYGRQCVEHFIGMFAFAIYTEDEIFIARDRLGIKPLYYAETKDGIVFASEAKALLASGDVQASVNSNSLPSYLSVGYVTGTDTLFSSIKKLAPGHLMIVNPKGGIYIKQYWQPTYEEQPVSEGEALDKFNALFNDAISLRMRSDVPVGVFLSGGLDSSAVVARLASSLKKEIKTFSVRYELPGFDETSYARQVASFYKTNHHEISMTPDMFQSYIPSYIWHMDEPVTEAAAISVYYLSKLAAEHVTVVLSGEGADEIMAGYEIYAYMQVLEKLHKIPDSFLAGMQHIGGLVNNTRLRKYSALARLPMEERYKGVSMYAHDSLFNQGKSLFNDQLTDQLQGDNPFNDIVKQCYQNNKKAASLNRFLDLDTRTWLPDDILVKADKMSMAASIELRVPFLDHRMVEFAGSLPVTHKLKKMTGKYLLREATRKELPMDIINRPKMGFPTPLKFMFEGPLYDYAHSVFSDRRCHERGIYNSSTLLNMLTQHKKGVVDHHKRLWQALVLELWHRVFIEGETV